MEKYFGLTDHKTNVRTELIAGLTTFLTMSYIIFVNPAMLSQTGMEFSSVFIATCVAAAIGTLIMGLYANLPFAQAPGMGLNAFFTFTVVFGLGYTWQQGLAIVFLSGILFLVLTITGVRRMIIDAIPDCLKYAIAPGIGLFIALIGLNNSGIIDMNQGPIIDIILQQDVLDKEVLISEINQAPPQVLQVGLLTDPSVLLAIFGFALLTILMVTKVKAAMVWSVIGTTVIGIPMGVTQIPTSYDIGSISMAPTFLELDLSGLFSTSSSIFAVILVIISFTLVDLLDTLGTLIGTGSKGGLLDEKGDLPNMNKALLADASATTIGSLLGTSSVTTYIESSAGVIEGGRTGLTAVTTGILFLLAIVLAPIAGVVPIAATAPILIMIGVLMMDGVRKIDFDNLESSIPAVILILVMPFTYSIANGIAFGLILYVLIQVVIGKGRSIHPILFLLVALFVMKYVLM